MGNVDQNQSGSAPILPIDVPTDPVADDASAWDRWFPPEAAEQGLRTPFATDERSSIVSLAVPDADGLEAALREHGVVAAVRGDFLRLSFHFFNDEGDVECALAAIADAGRRR